MPNDDNEPWQSQVTTTTPENSKFPMHYVRLITVEPTMILYMLAFMMTTVLEQDLFIYKACRVNHQFNETICRNIAAKENNYYKKQVQITVSNFHLINDIAGHLGPIILALFMGAWSDKRGRKLPLLIGLCGKLYYSIMIVVNATQSNWPLEYIVYTATLPMGLTGADVAIFAAAFTYLVDVTSEANRTMRVTLLEVCYLATMPIGIAFGSYIFTTSLIGRSYAKIFLLNVALMIVAIVYSWVRLEWRTNSRQRPLSADTSSSNIISDFFDYNHVLNTFKTLSKKRRMNRRSFLLILIFMMALYTFQRDEKNMSYMYTQLTFNWTSQQFSNFRTFQSTVQDLCLLIAIPVMSKWLGWRDTIIIAIGALAHTVARLFYANATTMWTFYMGGVLAAIGPICAPVIRSMVSKLVEASEKGKAFSVLAVADNAVPFISGVLYSKLYNFTIHTNPNAIYYLTMSTQIGVLLLILFIHFAAKDDEDLSSNASDQGVIEQCLDEAQQESK